VATRHRSIAVALPYPAGRGRRLSARTREALQGMGLLAPTVLILIGLILYPFFYAIWLAFSDKTIGSPAQFVGLR
jgi:multiple sugar transport system permease protein